MKQVTADGFRTEVLDSPIPVLADFFTKQCPPCRAMAPVVEQIESARNGAVKVVKIDAAAESSLAAAFRVTTVPTFILFRGGEQIAQFIGTRSRSEVERWLDDYLRGP